MKLVFISKLNIKCVGGFPFSILFLLLLLERFWKQIGREREKEKGKQRERFSWSIKSGGMLSRSGEYGNDTFLSFMLSFFLSSFYYFLFFLLLLLPCFILSLFLFYSILFYYYISVFIFIYLYICTHDGFPFRLNLASNMEYSHLRSL